MNKSIDSDKSVSGASNVLNQESDDKIRPCCEATIGLHARNNAMMVCGTCKHIIKCFQDPSSFKNYVKFCTSRHRKVIIGEIEGYHVVVFRAYEGFRN